MAPEVFFPMIAYSNRDTPWDRRTDIWALGCTVRFPQDIAFAVADIRVQMYEIAGTGQLFGRIGSPILVDMAALCGGAPADWISYFASISGKVPPQGVCVSHSCRLMLTPVPRTAYSPQAADALWAEKVEHLQKGGGIQRRMRAVYSR